MDERKTRILCSIIQDFICTGEPIGSRTLSRRYNFGVSSATIRNEMSDLEELGFLEQVHTSSGRRPSNKGYRLYVDKLMTLSKISKEEESFIKSDLVNLDIFGIENALKSKLTLISKLTNLACILKTRPVMKNSVKSIKFVRIDSDNILMVFVTNEGVIRNNVVRVSRDVSNDDIEKINRVINDNLVYRTVEEIDSQLVDKIRDSVDIDQCFSESIVSNLRNLVTFNSSCYVEGINNILSYPEFSDIDKMRNFLYFIDNRVVFESLLDCVMDDIEIRIGEENYVEEASCYSVILGNYKKSGKVLGTIGIIGPTRMDYPKIVSILKLLIDFVNLSIV